MFKATWPLLTLFAAILARQDAMRPTYVGLMMVADAILPMQLLTDDHYISRKVYLKIMSCVAAIHGGL